MLYICVAFVLSGRIKPLDILLMKQLHDKVNVVPLIAKADMLTIKEVEILKRRVSNLYIKMHD